MCCRSPCSSRCCAACSSASRPRFSRRGPRSCRRSRTRGDGQVLSRSRRWMPRLSLQKALVVGQISLLMLLLVGAGLFVQTVSNLHSVFAWIQPGESAAVRTERASGRSPAGNGAPRSMTTCGSVSRRSQACERPPCRTRRCSGQVVDTRCASMASSPRALASCRPGRGSSRRCRFRYCRAARSTSVTALERRRPWSSAN